MKFELLSASVLIRDTGNNGQVIFLLNSLVIPSVKPSVSLTMPQISGPFEKLRSRAEIYESLHYLRVSRLAILYLYNHPRLQSPNHSQ